jgi:hypothetical protein
MEKAERKTEKCNKNDTEIGWRNEYMDKEKERERRMKSIRGK